MFDIASLRQRHKKAIGVNVRGIPWRIGEIVQIQGGPNCGCNDLINEFVEAVNSCNGKVVIIDSLCKYTATVESGVEVVHPNSILELLSALCIIESSKPYIDLLVLPSISSWYWTKKSYAEFPHDFYDALIAKLNSMRGFLGIILSKGFIHAEDDYTTKEYLGRTWEASVNRVCTMKFLPGSRTTDIIVTENSATPARRSF